MDTCFDNIWDGRWLRSIPECYWHLPHIFFKSLLLHVEIRMSTLDTGIFLHIRYSLSYHFSQSVINKKCVQKCYALLQALLIPTLIKTQTFTNFKRPKYSAPVKFILSLVTLMRFFKWILIKYSSNHCWISSRKTLRLEYEF